MNTPLVSVVLPTFNRAYCLEKTLDSIFNQSYPSLEVIVIDDGSTDATRELIEQYSNTIQYFYQENAGVSAARNFGISKAQGEFVAFADSDDLWKPTKIKEQLAYFNLHPKIALCFTNAQVFKDDVEHDKFQVIPHIQDEIYGLLEVLQDPYFGLPSVMIKTDVLKSVGGFDPLLRTAEDLDLFLKVALNHKVGYLHSKLVEIYVSEGSLSSTSNSYEDNIYVLTRFFKTHKKVCQDIGFDIDKALCDINKEYAKSLLWQGQNRLARKRVFIALKYKFCPSLIYLYLKSFIR